MVPAHRKYGPDRETLHRLYVVEKLSMREIGLRCGAHGKGAARRWLIESGIEVRPRGWNTNGVKSEAHRLALVASRTGQNSHWWRGGVSSDAVKYRASKEWSLIRLSVYERDGWTCQDCCVRCLNTRDSKKYPKRKIQCHHVIRRRDGGPDTPDNLVTLCMSCHHKRERRYADALFA